MLLASALLPWGDIVTEALVQTGESLRQRLKLSHPQIPDHKPQEVTHMYWFKPLSAGLVGYTAVDNKYNDPRCAITVSQSPQQAFYIHLKM